MPSIAHTSEVISELAGEAEGTVTVEEILGALGNRVYALLIVVLGLPNCLPLPLPIPFICGLLLAFVALQFAFGKRRPWIPRIILERSIRRSDIARIARRAVPLFEKLERYSRPRLMIMVEPIAHRVLGFVVVFFSLALLCTPPFLQMPLGIAICLIGLGLVERDGVIVFAGIVIGVAGIWALASFIYAMVIWIGALLL